MKPLLTTTTAIVALTAGAAAAQQSTGYDQPIAISAWAYDELYSIKGVRGEELLDRTVMSAGRDSLGAVEDILIEDDRIIAIVAELGGVLDVGDTHVVVPWDEVRLGADGYETPLNEGNLERYDMWSEGSAVDASIKSITRAPDGGVLTAGGVYRLSDIVDDYVTAEGVGVGYVDDVVFSSEGEVRAVVWLAEGGYFAAPFMGPDQGYEPGTNRYELRYGFEEIKGLEPFDYGRLSDNWF
jgi:hypothetical protein